MNNFKSLYYYEFIKQIHSLKFLLLLIVSVLVTFICIYTQTKDFENKKHVYQGELIKADKIKDSFRVYADFKIPILIAPNPLSIFAKGEEDLIGNKIEVSITELPELEQNIQRENPFLNIFNAFDILTLVQMVFSLFIILLTSDVITREKEDHTLKYIFVNEVGRVEYFISKLFANFTILLIPLISIFLMTLLFIQLSPEITLGAENWLKVVLIFFSCVIYISIFLTIGLFLSLMCKTSNNSLMLGLLLWITIVFIYPNTVKYIVCRTYPIPTNYSINSQKNKINDDLEKNFMSNFYNSVDWSISGGNMNLYFLAYEETNYKGLPRFIGVLQKYLLEGYIKALNKDFPMLFDAQKEIEQVNEQVLKAHQKQDQIISSFLCINPNYLLEEGTTILAGTNYKYRKILIEQKVRLYRKQLLRYLDNKDAFSASFFTWMTPDNMKHFTKDYSNEEIIELENEIKSLKLELSDIPQFNMVQDIHVPIVLVQLLLIFLVLFGASFYFLNKKIIITQ
ncbi:MAG: ABC transporter permease [Draconibacterium sp.]